MKTNFVLKINDAGCSTYVQTLNQKNLLVKIGWWNTIYRSIQWNFGKFSGKKIPGELHQCIAHILHGWPNIYVTKKFSILMLLLATRFLYSVHSDNSFLKIRKQHTHTNMYSRRRKNNPISHSNLTAASIKIKAWFWCLGYKNKSFSFCYCPIPILWVPKTWNTN